MATRDDLNAAVAAGVISQEAADNLAAFWGSKLGEGSRAPAVASAATGPLDEEPLRFIRNFHDIFLAIGLGIFAIGLSLGVAEFVDGRSYIDADDDLAAFRTFSAIMAGLLAGCAAVMWGLGEYFARAKRLFFPAIVICIAFVGFIYTAGLFAYGAVIGQVIDNLGPEFEDWRDLSVPLRLAPVVISGVLVAALAAFYIRFRLPFSMGLLGLSLTGFVVAVLFTLYPPLVDALGRVLIFLIGVSVFALGMAFDMRDTARETRFSDNGFWLHLMAAPFLLWGAQLLIFGFTTFQDAYSPGGAVVTLVVIFLFALISLLVNRRALVVSGLVTAGIAMSIILREAGLGAAGLGAATLLALGGLVVVLGASWRSLRAVLIAPFPKTGVIARLIPPQTVDG